MWKPAHLLGKLLNKFSQLVNNQSDEKLDMFTVVLSTLTGLTRPKPMFHLGLTQGPISVEGVGA